MSGGSGVGSSALQGPNAVPQAEPGSKNLFYLPPRTAASIWALQPPPSRLRAAAVLGSCCHCLLVHVVSLLHPFASSWSASQLHQTFHQPLQNAYGRRGKKQENTEESLGAGWRRCNGSQRELCHAGAVQTRGSQPWDSVARLSICPHHG